MLLFLLSTAFFYAQISSMKGSSSCKILELLTRITYEEQRRVDPLISLWRQEFNGQHKYFPFKFVVLTKTDLTTRFIYLNLTSWRGNVMEKCKTFEPLMEGHCFLKNKLVGFKSCHLLSCFDEILFMHQVVLSFAAAFWEFFN